MKIFLTFLFYLFIKGRYQKKTWKCRIFSQVGAPPTPVWEWHVCEKKKIKVYFAFQDLRNIYCWGVSHLKNSKKWKWDLGRPPPFLLVTSLNRMYLFPLQHPNPVQFVSNLFLPGGFELAKYADSKVTICICICKNCVFFTLPQIPKYHQKYLKKFHLFPGT